MRQSAHERKKSPPRENFSFIPGENAQRRNGGKPTQSAFLEISKQTPATGRLAVAGRLNPSGSLPQTMRYGKARISQRWSIGGGKARLPRSPDWTRWAVCCERWDVWKRESAKADWNGSEKVLLLYRAGRSVEQLAVNDGIRGSEDWTRPTGMPAGTFCCRISLGWRHWAVCRKRWECGKSEYWQRSAEMATRGVLLYKHRMGYPS